MKSLNKITILNTLSIVLLQGIAFFTTPIFTRMLGTSQYGLYSVFFSWVSIFSCLMGLGVGSALATGKYQFKETYYEFRSSLLLLGSLISLIIILGSILFISPISNITRYHQKMVILMLFFAFANFVIRFVQDACVYEKRAGMNVFISISLSVISVGLSLLLIPRFEEESKYLGRIYGSVYPYFLIAVCIWGITYFKKPTGIRKDYCKFGLMVGVPVVFHSLAGMVLSQSDRVMMQSMGILSSEIGIYSLYYTFANVMATLLDALNVSWCPFYYDDLDNKNWDMLRKKCRNYIELFTTLTIGFLLLAREVGYLLADQDYWSGMDLIPIIVLSVYCTFMYKFPVNFEFFHKKTGFIAIGTCGAALLNVLLNFLLIPYWGIYGAAIATTFAHGMLFIFHYEIVVHMSKHPYHLKISFFIPGVITVCAGMVMFYLWKDLWYVRWICGALIGIYELKRILKRKTIF